MNPILIEAVGISASVMILISMLFKTTSVKGSIVMRALNIVGSVIFTIYGCILPAISTAVLNAALVIVNVYHLILLLKEQKQQK